MRNSLIKLILVAAILLLSVSPIEASPVVGNIVYATGDAWVEAGKSRKSIDQGQSIFQYDTIVTGGRGRVKIKLNDGSKIFISSRSRITLKDFATHEQGMFKISLDMLWGKARFFVNKLIRKNSSFQVRTTTAVLGVRGTEFSVSIPEPKEPPRLPTLDNLPPLPTFTMLMKGAVNIRTVSGLSFDLLPGENLLVGVDGSVKKEEEAGGTYDDGSLDDSGADTTNAMQNLGGATATVPNPITQPPNNGQQLF